MLLRLPPPPPLRIGSEIIGFYNVEPFYHQLIRCNGCQRFGHTTKKNARQINQDAPLCQNHTHRKKVTICANCGSHEHGAAFSGCPVAVKYFNEIQTKNNIIKQEDLKRSPDLLNNVKIGQGQLQLIMEQFFCFYHIHFGHVI